jgi:hypothetical protein
VAELVIALAPLLALVALALLALFVPLQLLALGALALMALGFLLGVPTGLYYHVLLRRELLAEGALPKGWYWQPQKHHAALSRERGRRLLPWFLAGALGFALIMLGFLLAVTAFLLWFRAERAVLP